MASASTLSSTSPLFGIKSSTNRSTRRQNSVRISDVYASSTTTALLYDVLNIQTNATFPEIKQAYRRLARVSHPDVASSGTDEFIRIHSAYATLSDPQKRADYDRTMFVRLRPAS
ncbi:unnamed protein product [Rhodiola kirilowii]